MYAAIKALEDTLFIRRLQAKELAYDSDKDRHTAIMRDIASLEKGLLALQAREAENGKAPGSPTNGDPGKSEPI